MSTTAWTLLGSDIDGLSTNVYTGSSVSLNAAGTRAAIGSQNATYGVRIYDFNGATWTQTGVITVLGKSVSLSADGMRVAIGAYDFNTVYIYDLIGATWTLKLTLNGQSTDNFGQSVSLSADGMYLAIGAPGVGYGRIYRLNGSSWEKIGSDITTTYTSTSLGSSVSLSANGRRLAIGSLSARGTLTTGGNYVGSVDIYDLDNTTWTLKGARILGATNYDQFGCSVSLSGDGMRIAIGAYRGFNYGGTKSGNVNVYDLVGSNWEQKGGMIGGDQDGIEFGTSVSLSTDGTRIAIGAPYYDGIGGGNSINGNIGRTYVYTLNTAGTDWTLAGFAIDGEKGLAIGSGNGDLSGFSVSLSADGTRLAIGAPFNDVGGSSAINKGHVRVYEMLKPPTVPDAPTIGTIVTGKSKVVVNFTPGQNGGSAITGYTVKLYNGTTNAYISPDILINTAPTATSLEVTGLTNGTAYKFALIAINTIGSSVASALSSQVTLPTVSGVPTNVTAVAGNAQATVSFTAPVSNGGAIITGYTVISSPGGVIVSNTSSPIIVTGLTNGTQYTFTVVATNSAGDSLSSGASVAVTPVTPSVASLISSNIITKTASAFVSGLQAVTITDGSLVDTVTLGMVIPVTATDHEKKIANKKIIATIFENKPSLQTFKVKSSNLAIAASNIKEDVIIVKSAASATNLVDVSVIALDSILNANTSVYTALENVGEKQKFSIGGKIYSIVKTTNGYEFTGSTGTSQQYLEGQTLNYEGLVLTFGGVSISANDAAGYTGSSNTPVEVNLNIAVDANGKIDIFGAVPVELKNVIVAEETLPASTLYTSTNSMFEFWEPEDNQSTIGVNETGLIYADLTLEDAGKGRDWKKLTRALENGIHDCLNGVIDATLAVPFNDSKYANNPTEYRKANSFGHLALASVSHYIMGHVAATASITNDKDFIDNMNSCGSSEPFAKWTGADLLAVDDFSTVPAGNASNARLAKSLVNKIVTKTADKIAEIARQVIGQDASRAMDQDNNKFAPDVRHALKFIAGDVIYMNIKLQKPTVVVDGGQQVSDATLNAKFPAVVSETTTDYTLKITLS